MRTDEGRDISPSPTTENCQNDPERAFSFLQQLDGKLAILSMHLHLNFCDC